MASCVCQSEVTLNCRCFLDTDLVVSVVDLTLATVSVYFGWMKQEVTGSFRSLSVNSEGFLWCQVLCLIVAFEYCSLTFQ